MQEYSSENKIEVTITNPILGVPITYLDKHNPEQFEIYGATESEGKGFSHGLWKNDSNVSQPVVNGERVYKRILIRKHSQNNQIKTI